MTFVFFLCIFVSFFFKKNTYVVYITYELEKFSQTIFLKQYNLKKNWVQTWICCLQSWLLPFVFYIFSVVDNSWYVCVCRTERSSKGLTQFYLQRKGQMIKKCGGTLLCNWWEVRLWSSVSQKSSNLVFLIRVIEVCVGQHIWSLCSL